MEMSPKKAMDEDCPGSAKYVSIDDMLEYIGEFGAFQRKLDVICFILSLAPALQWMIMTFSAINPPWRCVRNSSICLFNNTLSSEDRSRCHMPRSEWRYAASVEYSMVTQFDLCCDREWLIHLLTSAFFIGYGLGSVVLGWVADNYGRKRVIIVTHLLIIITGVVTSFLRSIILIVIFRCISGFLYPGSYCQMFVLIYEVVGRRKRTMACQVLQVSLPFACCVLTLTAYFLREWKLLFIVCTAPYLVSMFLYKFIPESIRWMRLQGRLEEISSALRDIARLNKKVMPENIEISHIDGKTMGSSTTVSDIFRGKKLAVRSLVQGYLWFAISLVYYGLYIAANDLGGSLYRDFVILSLADVPSFFLLGYFLERFGRKNTVIYNAIIASAACLSIAFVPIKGNLNVLRIMLGTIGKLFILTSFNGAYIWSLEIYPTKVRAVGFGFVEVCARVGSVAAPWVAIALKSVSKGAPFIVMGIVSLTAACLAFLLPETKGKSTAECIEESSHTRKDFGASSSSG